MLASITGLFAEPWVLTLLKVIAVFAVVMPMVAYSVVAERRISAWIQDRIGPNRVGIPFTNIRLLGLGQPLADGLKALVKEDFTPAHVRKAFYWMAPALVLVPEPSGERVVLSAPGRAVFRLALETAGGHATREGESALARMAEIALEIEAMAVAGSQVVLEFTSRARGLSHPQDAQLVVDRHLVLGELREAAREALAQLDPRLAVAEAERSG